MQPDPNTQTDDQKNTTTDNHVTIAGLEFEGSTASALESAFASELKAAPTTAPTSNTAQHATTDFSEKVAQIEHRQEGLAQKGEVLKTDIESKIKQLKDLKKTIEEELATLKSLEQKKKVYDTEIEKIKELEHNQKNVEEEINKLITTNE